MATQPEALIFDLFGTLVFFDDSLVPRMDVGGRSLPMTVRGLPDLVARALPATEVTTFLGQLRRISSKLLEEKKREGTELHTSVRFERTLVSLGAGQPLAAEVAQEMAKRHMEALAAAVVCPPGRKELLEQLGRSYRLALLSNFDDGATARRVLSAAGLTPFFEVILVSEEEGVRKPSRLIFERALQRLALEAKDALYVGDTLVEDVHGATAAGMDAVWVHADRNASSPARVVLHDVEALPHWLASRGASG